MKMKKLKIRVLLRYLWKQNLKATEAANKICEAEGEGVVSNRTAHNWFKRFNDEAPVSKMTHALVAKSLWTPKPCVKRSEPIRQPALADCPLNSTFHGRQLFGNFSNSTRSRNTVEERRMN
jgi:hypothetical protein